MGQVITGKFGDLAHIAHRLVDDLFKQALNSQAQITLETLGHRIEDLKTKASYQAILNSDPQVQIQVVYALLQRSEAFSDQYQDGSYYHDQSLPLLTLPWHLTQQLFSTLLDRHLPYTETDLCALLDDSNFRKFYWFHCSGLGDRLLQLIEQRSSHEIRPELVSRLNDLKQYAKNSYWPDASKFARRIDNLLLIPGTWEAGDPWSDLVIADLQALPTDLQAHWQALLTHAQDSDKSAPTQKWLKMANQFIEPIGVEAVHDRLQQWFEWANQVPGSYQFSDRNSLILKGLVWCCLCYTDQPMIQTIADFADTCFKKLPGIGPRALKVGNACVYLLSQTPGLYAVAQLDRLQQSVKNKTIQRQLEKAFRTAAERAGLSREDLVELAVPTFNLDADGSLQQTFGTAIATLQIMGSRQVSLSWSKDGKALKSIPTEVKRDYSTEFKAFKRQADELQKVLQTQAKRLENLYLNPRSWELTTWRDRYLQHPLLTHLARQLIWQFHHDRTFQTGIWHQGHWVDRTGQAMTPPDSAQVTLWHPIQSAAEDVLAWRTWLEEQHISQPFKQAHREIYLLTEAELETNTYSNRFAAHIIKQHQFNALCKDRGWGYSLQGGFDGYNTPTLTLPQWQLQVEFWVDPAGEDMSEAGIHLYLSTDQVRFYNLQREQQRLVDIPAIVFSEVLRDVDLFVGVCSIGNDPNWHDRGETADYQDYWWNYSFGDLSTSAQVRRELLTRLLPKLQIRDRCQITDTFLIVQGDLRTYKIHLGSGNILMEPNHQYLCIVPARGEAKTGDRVFLPFDGDSTLSVILSKALLLAADTKINDPSILSQIQQR